MTTPTHARRPGATVLAAIVGAALFLTGCAAAGPSQTAPTAPSPSQTGSAASGPTRTAPVASSPRPTASASASAARFPVTIDTAYGEITVDDKPERIVVLNGRHIEMLDLLGETPVAFTDYGATNEELLTSYPWMDGMLKTEADPALFVGGTDPSAEAIAAQEPDLILTTIWQTDEQLYEQLSQIAPTYVGIEPTENTLWQDDLRAIAGLTGHDPAIVDETQAELDDAMKAAAARLPGLQGKSFQLAILTEGQQFQLTEYGVPPVLGLGLVPAEGQPIVGEGHRELSWENADQLTADVVLIATRSSDFTTQFRTDPRLAALPSTQNQTLVFFDTPQWLAINGGTAVSELWWLEQIVPELESSALNRSDR